jgi:hypothetical protein
VTSNGSTGWSGSKKTATIQEIHFWRFFWSLAALPLTACSRPANSCTKRLIMPMTWVHGTSNKGIVPWMSVWCSGHRIRLELIRSWFESRRCIRFLRENIAEFLC